MNTFQRVESQHRRLLTCFEARAGVLGLALRALPREQFRHETSFSWCSHCCEKRSLDLFGRSQSVREESRTCDRSSAAPQRHVNFHSPRHLASAILEGVSPAFFQLLLACSSLRRSCHQGAAMQGSDALVQLAAVHPPSGHSSVSVCTSFVVHLRKSVQVLQQLESSKRQSVRSHGPIVITSFFAN